MTVSSNYSSYASYSNSSAASAQQMQKPNFEELANEIMSSLDSDGNGSINLDEFSSALKSNSSSSSNSLSDIFSSIDTDSNGAMSSEEFMAALKASKPQPPQGGEMGAMPPPPPPSESSEKESSDTKNYSSLDKNQDGTVSLEELLSTLNDKSQEESKETTSSSNDTFEKIKNGMLEKMLSYCSSDSSYTTSSTMSLSA